MEVTPSSSAQDLTNLRTSEPVQKPITASMLYDLIACPHRVTMDLCGDPSKREEVNVFLRLLWEKGTLFEREVIGKLDLPFLDLSFLAGEEKEHLTKEAMDKATPLIYGGRIRAEDLLGDPDLLRWEGHGYIPGDIKSGSGEEGKEEARKPKTHYAVQLGLYIDILERQGISAGRRGFIWDIHGEEVVYDFDIPQGQRTPRSLWMDYQGCLQAARSIVAQQGGTLPAYGAPCKLCYWRTACLHTLRQSDDLTLIPELGRSKRDTISSRVVTITDLANTDLACFLEGPKTVFPGIGIKTLEKLHRRARLVKEPHPRPRLLEPVTFPEADLEIFFDIETDPLRDVCYLHGFLERRPRDSNHETYIPCFAEGPSPEAEEDVFQRAWAYLQSHPNYVLYYYSKYERTFWRKLQRRYPTVCTESDVETLFDPERAIDLYTDVVLRKTDWPTIDYSIKTLAKYLGFRWRDPHPSGAASIEWFHRWVETGDPLVKQRILDYNEDDCRATRVLVDGIRRLS